MKRVILFSESLQMIFALFDFQIDRFSFLNSPKGCNIIIFKSTLFLNRIIYNEFQRKRDASIIQ